MCIRDRERAELGPFSRGEKNTLVVFVVAVVLWFSPGFLAMVLGENHTCLLYTSRCV